MFHLVGKSGLYILIGLIIILAAGLGYFIFQNQKLLDKLTNASPTPATISPPPAIQIQSPSPLISPSPKLTLAEVLENIEAAINSKNTAALATYMTKPKVNFVLMSTECCEPQTPDQAIAQMSYIKEGIPMDFNQNSDLVKNLKSKNPQLTNTFIGISKAKEQLAALTINSENRISQIQLAATWKLYNF